MRRTGWAVLLLAALAAACIALTEVRTDPASVLGGTGLPEAEGPAAGSVTVALVSDDRAARTAFARRLAGRLAEDPVVAEALSGPVAPSAEALDWLWRNRYLLAPPLPGDFAADAMADRLRQAREALAGPEGLALGDRLLRDASGSFSRLLARLRGAAPALPVADGVWQSRDGRAALLFLALRDDAPMTAVRAMAAGIGAEAEAAAMRAIVIGPRVIAARISGRLERASALAGGVAGALLLLWLGVVLRGPSAVGRALLPLGIGLGAAVLSVTLIWGSVHVIALGFGGALTGLALDYPLHLAGHAGGGRARRLVLVGAATTAVAFLAMLFAGPQALAETGVFVASGLVAAALSARWLADPAASTPRGVAVPVPRLPRSRWPEAACIAAGVLALALGPARPPERLVELPEGTEAALAELRAMVDLPSARAALVVEAEDAPRLAARLRAAGDWLDAAAADGLIARAALPPVPLGDAAAQRATLGALPDAETLRPAVGTALSQAGLAPSFAGAVLDAHREAREAAPLSPGDAPDAAARAAMPPVDAPPRATVALRGVSDPAPLAARLADQPLPGARLIDRKAAVEAALADLRGNVVVTLAGGAAAALAILAIALRRPAVAAGIALTVAAALGATVALLAVLTGPPGIFQTVALALVAGIGIDYGVFTATARTAEERARATASVWLCAGSTLIAFAVMAATPTRVLSEIGITVSVGVLATALLALGRARAGD